LEVGFALFVPLPKFLLNSLMILMSTAKAFFIVGEFMHLRYEVRALMLTICVPVLLLIWAVIAFLMEGTAWLQIRQLWQQ